MHPNPRKIAPIVLLVLGLAALVYWFFFLRTPVSIAEGITASGTIEVTRVNLGPELAGRVKALLVEEGQTVAAGAVLLQQDDALLKAQRSQAEAALAAARAGLEAAKASLALLEVGPSPEQLAVSEAAVNQAQVAYDAARAVYDDLSESMQDTTEGKAALARADAAGAALETARAQLDLVKAGSRLQQIEAARQQVELANAQVQSAEAALEVLDVQIGRLTLVSPVDGVVMECTTQVGEFASPGSTLLVLGQAGSKTITVYISEELYGQISIGQAAEVKVDSFAGETFTASVVHIADQAEFTPRNVQTTEGRKNTVFAIKLKLSDPGGKLKPGMPADVVFGQ